MSEIEHSKRAVMFEWLLKSVLNPSPISCHAHTNHWQSAIASFASHKIRSLCTLNRKIHLKLGSSIVKVSGFYEIAVSHREGVIRVGALGVCYVDFHFITLLTSLSHVDAYCLTCSRDYSGCHIYRASIILCAGDEDSSDWLYKRG